MNDLLPSNETMNQNSWYYPISHNVTFSDSFSNNKKIEYKSSLLSLDYVTENNLPFSWIIAHDSIENWNSKFYPRLSKSIMIENVLLYWILIQQGYDLSIKSDFESETEFNSNLST